jgi:hypothetical protein
MDLSRAEWRKASYSNSNGGACVEVARNLPGAVAIRDSKNPAGPALLVTPRQWTALCTAIKHGGLTLS